MIELITILLAKALEVTLSTLRTVFISRGKKAYAASIGFVEVLIWLKVASLVLVGIDEFPARMIVYALGFSLGSIIGLTIEEKLGIGYSNIQIITNEEDGDRLAKMIRKEGKAVTIIQGEGRDDSKVILSTYVKRKNKNVILNCVKELEIQGVVTVSETQKIYGGFGLKK